MKLKTSFDRAAFRLESLPTQEQIMESWHGEPDNPLVSVMCTTYNHKNYIVDAFRGFLKQKTCFPFEIVIHDDASTDGTSDIVREYVARYPCIFKAVVQEENQYSKGEKPSLLCFKHTKGQYLAMCEGDDFWIAPDKLEKQMKVFDENKEAALLVAPSLIETNEKIIRKIHGYHGGAKREFGAGDIISRVGQFAPTSSYMFKRKVFEEIPYWFKDAPVGDTFLELIAVSKGKGIYIPYIQSVYRKGAIGSWTLVHKRADASHLASHGIKFRSAYAGYQYDNPKTFLNTSVREATLSLRIAKAHLSENNYEKFYCEIVRSWSTKKHISKLQFFLFALRKFPLVAKSILRNMK